MSEKAPDDQDEKAQTDQLDQALDEGLKALREDNQEKLHSNMSVMDQRHGGGKGYGNELRHHHDVQGTEYRGKKKLGPYDVDTGYRNHDKNGKETY